MRHRNATVPQRDLGSEATTEFWTKDGITGRWRRPPDRNIPDSRKCPIADEGTTCQRPRVRWAVICPHLLGSRAVRPPRAGRGAWRTGRNPGRCAAGHTRFRCIGLLSRYRWSCERSRRACVARGSSSPLESRSPGRPTPPPSAKSAFSWRH